LAGVSNGATNGLSLLVNTMLPLTLVSPVRAGSKILLSFLVSLLLFREKFSARQLVGVGMGTAALVLLQF
jgi:multidrug transporter EmrE-like cation transporter